MSNAVGLPVAEAAVAFVTALTFLLICSSVKVNPLTRAGQVSGLAGLQFRFAVFGILLVGGVVLALRSRRTRVADVTVRMVCAAVAGLATGLIGAGLAVALSKTPYGLYAYHGDMGQLITWANDAKHGKALPKTYPPLPAEIIATLSSWTGQSPAYAIKTFQIFGAAVYGPLAYLSWRLVLRPVSALLVGVLASLPLMDLYKPYTNIVLVMMVPVLVKFVEALRGSGVASYRRNAVSGLIFGVGMGLLFELYFGWFLWSALGVAVAVCAVFPWRTREGREAWKRAATLLGVTGVAFFAVTFQNLIPLMTSGAGSDKYIYFDVRTEPTYFLHWFSDEPPAGLGAWPPIGDLGGVGLFTMLLFVGFAAAVALRRRDVVVLVVASSVLSAWLMRFWTAEHMYATGTVGLYPRTDVQILFGLLVLSAFMARHFVVAGVRSDTVTVRLDAFKRTAMVPGVLTGVLFLTASMGDATANSYMPTTSGPGNLAMVSHTTLLEDGQCAAFTTRKDNACAPSAPPTSVGP